MSTSKSRRRRDPHHTLLCAITGGLLFYCRSLKYLPLFLGLFFLSYLVFEAITGKRVHSAQYTL